MLLGGGKLGKTRVLQAETVALMGRNQIGDLPLTEIKSLARQFARSLRMPESLDKFGLGFAINTQAVEGGRASGSMACARIYNTFFWIDPARKTTAVLMMQFLPFLDDVARGCSRSLISPCTALRPVRIGGSQRSGSAT